MALTHEKRIEITKQLDKLCKKRHEKRYKIGYGDYVRTKHGTYIRALQGWYRV